MTEASGNTGTRVRNSAEDFIRVWQGSESVQEAADKLGITKESAGQRASHYRSQLGIQLKKMSKGAAKLDVAALQALAQQTAPQTEAEEKETETATS